jgi:hypothetical protein
MRDPSDPVSLALDAPARPMRDALPISEALARAIYAGALEPPWHWPEEQVPRDFTPPFAIPSSVEMFRRLDTPTVVDYSNDREPVVEYKLRVTEDGETFQRLHTQYPELARAVLEPCVDSSCARPPPWGAWCDTCRTSDATIGRLCPRCGSGHIIPRRALWDVIRHLRRDHMWPRSRVVARLTRRGR